MTASRNYSNTAQQTTLSADCTAAATTISVSSTTGFPAAPYILAVDYGSGPQELVLVTGVAGTTLTVTRGFDNTTAQSHSTGAVVAHTHAAKDFADSRNHEGDSTGVHGITGTVVGTSDAQTLTHKDLTDPTNVFPSTFALDSDVTAVANDLTTHEADTSAHGVTGAVVGTTDTQVLTNKDLSDPSNTLPAKLEGAASLAGAIVGTSDTQTLTHKDLSDPSNTFPPGLDVVFAVDDGTTNTETDIARPLIRAGSIKQTMASGTTMTSGVTFETGNVFASLPSVTLAVNSKDVYVNITEIFTYGFNFRISSRSGAAWSGTPTITWIAVGQAAV